MDENPTSSSHLILSNVTLRRSIANANAPDVDAAVCIFELLPLGVASSVNRLIAGLIIARATVITAVGLRADDRAHSQTADDASGDCAAIAARVCRL